MDTKSRNIRYFRGFKLIAVLLCVAGLLAAAWGLLSMRNFEAAVQGGEYAQSYAYASAVATVYDNVYRAAFGYKSDLDIQSGERLANNDMYLDTVAGLQRQSNDAVASLEEEYQIKLDEAWRNKDTTLHTALTNELALRIQSEKDKLSSAIANEKEQAIQQQLGDYHSVLEYLKSLDDMVYMAVSADGTKFGNVTGSNATESAFAALPGSVILNDKQLGAQLPGGNRFGYNPLPKGCSVYIAMAQERFNKETADYNGRREAGITGIWQLAAGVLAFLLGLGWLLYAAGRRPGVEGVQLLPTDHLYLDIALLAAAAVAAFCIVSLIGLYNMRLNGYSLNYDMVYVLGALLVACLALTLVLFLTSVAKRLKRHEFIKHTLLYTILSWMWRIVKGALNAGPLALKTVLLFCGYALLSAILVTGMNLSAVNGNGTGAGFLFLLYLAITAAALVYLLVKAAAMGALLKGTEQIKQGNVSYRIAAAGGAHLAALAGSINNIAEGLNSAVESRVKSERMKTELVTNVSHDLRTPLTSIITYVDLLKAEGPASENAAKYIDILDGKAKRLKALTDDLFEAAKAASGSITPKLEVLDVNELLTQGLGELADRISESSLDIRRSLPKEPLRIMADGRLLWRVMENLLSNVFKYALPHSRVYIDAGRSGGRVSIAVKNISAFELNMPPEELMERFARGDQSRTSDGSGLGLAIARSLIELQGGNFKIEIDGDLFKAIISFPEFH